MPELTQEQIAALTLEAYASENHVDIYKCGCEIPNGANNNFEFNFVCDECYEFAKGGKS